MVLTQQQIEIALRASFGSIIDHLVAQDKVYLAGFLNFDTAYYAGAMRPHPQHPEQKIPTDPHYRITVQPSASVKERLDAMIDKNDI
ncbi:Bacterial DNA-binding protein [compost metagenome]